MENQFAYIDLYWNDLWSLKISYLNLKYDLKSNNLSSIIKDYHELTRNGHY